ncbi:MAG TPA: pyridoxine 5'-phosphate synthase [Polyangiaceae bacterium]|nr:pyridoxine 5'-phosphate synthase [Polyangiaceae bacterium]
MRPLRLHINIDHVATLRNQRDVDYPDPFAAAELCLAAGADGITVHLREDRRHIRDTDVERLCAAQLGLINLEMAATEAMQDIAERVRPQVITLVPEKRQERTTEGGLDVIAAAPAVAAVAAMCVRTGIKLSLFIEANEQHVRAARELGAAQVEFHTGHYCDVSVEQRPALLSRIQASSTLAHSLGLEVAAGHGLNCDNVGPIAAIPEMQELNIGHSVVADAVLLGMHKAVTNLRAALVRARRP